MKYLLSVVHSLTSRFRHTPAVDAGSVDIWVLPAPPPEPNSPYFADDYD